MSKNSKIVIAILLIIAVILICVFVLPKKDSEEQTNNVISTENIVNEIENTVSETNTVENEFEEEPIIENKTEVPEQGKVYEENSSVGTTDKKQEAIALVKQKWGEDDTVTFRCDSITNDGEYIIAVISSQSATVKNYFKVNLETETVEVDY